MDTTSWVGLPDVFLFMGRPVNGNWKPIRGSLKESHLRSRNHRGGSQSNITTSISSVRHPVLVKINGIHCSEELRLAPWTGKEFSKFRRRRESFARPSLDLIVPQSIRYFGQYKRSLFWKTSARLGLIIQAKVTWPEFSISWELNQLFFLCF